VEGLRGWGEGPILSNELKRFVAQIAEKMARASRVGPDDLPRHGIANRIGANPISFVVPYHRALGKNGALTGYYWGLTRKRAILGWEAGKA
jgi:O6-methylguanine-DNA--protein-cysteine methyltransferase